VGDEVAVTTISVILPTTIFSKITGHRKMGEPTTEPLARIAKKNSRELTTIKAGTARRANSQVQAAERASLGCAQVREMARHLQSRK
jgi:hypothetical protein